MDQVVKLADYRKPRPAPKMEQAARFFCTACDSETFRLLCDGTVHCERCGKLMGNLKVMRS